MIECLTPGACYTKGVVARPSSNPCTMPAKGLCNPHEPLRPPHILQPVKSVALATRNAVWIWISKSAPRPLCFSRFWFPSRPLSLRRGAKVAELNFKKSWTAFSFRRGVNLATSWAADPPLTESYGWQTCAQGHQSKPFYVLEGFLRVSETGAQRCGCGGVFARPLSKTTSTIYLQCPNRMDQKRPQRFRTTIFCPMWDCSIQKVLAAGFSARWWQLSWYPAHRWKQPAGVRKCLAYHTYPFLVAGCGCHSNTPRSRMDRKWSDPPSTRKKRMVGESNGSHHDQGRRHRHHLWNPHDHAQPSHSKSTSNLGSHSPKNWQMVKKPPAPKTMPRPSKLPPRNHLHPQKKRILQWVTWEMARRKATSPLKKWNWLRGLNKNSSLQGFNLLECGGDGACGYNALSAAYFMANNPGTKHPTKTHSVTMGKTLRQQIKAHIEKHRSDYEPFFAVMDTWTTVTEGGDIPQKFWLKSLLRETRWICHRSLQAGANRLGVHITVLIDNDEGEIVQVPCNRKKAKVVVLYLKGHHYQAVIPDGDWPKEWVQEVDALSQIPKAGGKTDSQHFQSPQPNAQWMPDCTPASSSKAISTPRKKLKTQEWFPTSTPRSQNSTPRTLQGIETPRQSNKRARVDTPPTWMPAKTPTSARTQESKQKKVQHFEDDRFRLRKLSPATLKIRLD